MKKIICSMLGHKYRRIRKINNYIEEIYCSRCMQEFVLNHEMRVCLHLDDELRELNCEIKKDQKRGLNY